MTPKIVALVPMRHQSERVPGKNYRVFAGKPLYHHIINTLLSCPLISDILIDTDSQVIFEDAARNFPQIKLIERPLHLRSGTTPMNEVLLYDINQIDGELYLQTHSTNPLLRSETIMHAIEVFIAQRDYDSLFGVTRLQTRLYDMQGRALNHNPNELIRTQDLPPVFEENSNLYLFCRKTLEAYGSRIGRHPLMFEIGRVEAWDIDEEIDFQISEFLYLERERRKALGVVL